MPTALTLVVVFSLSRASNSTRGPSRPSWPWGPKTGFIERERTERIFGIDFRVTFGSDKKQFLNVGERVPQQSELTFVADRDDVPISIVDAFELPPEVLCSLEGFQVVEAAEQP